MTLRIVDMLLARPKLDIFVVAEHLLRCLDLLVARSAADRYRNVLLQAGQLASSQGAHEIALTYLLGADRLVFGGDIWEDDYRQAFDLKLHLAESVLALLASRSRSRTHAPLQAPHLAQRVRRGSKDCGAPRREGDVARGPSSLSATSTCCLCQRPPPRGRSLTDPLLSQSAQNCWRQNQHMNCLLLLIEALKTLGVQVSASATEFVPSFAGALLLPLIH